MQIDKTLTEKDFRKILKNTKETLCKTKLIGSVAKKLKKRSAKEIVCYFIADIDSEGSREKWNSFRYISENSEFFDKNKKEILKTIEYSMRKYTYFNDIVSYHRDFFKHTKKEIEKLKLILTGEEWKDEEENHEGLMAMKYYLVHKALTIIEVEIGIQYRIYCRSKRYAKHKTN